MNTDNDTNNVFVTYNFPVAPEVGEKISKLD